MKKFLFLGTLGGYIPHQLESLESFTLILTFHWHSYKIEPTCDHLKLNHMKMLTFNMVFNLKYSNFIINLSTYTVS